MCQKEFCFLYSSRAQSVKQALLLRQGQTCLNMDRPRLLGDTWGQLIQNSHREVVGTGKSSSVVV